MKRESIVGTLLALLAGNAWAGLLITSESSGETSQQYFGKGEFIVIDQGQPRFGIDRRGNCWFVERQNLVSDPCENMLSAMSGMRDQAMAGLGPQERAMMEQMMGGGRTAQPLKPRPQGSRQIAGYTTDCHQIGSEREVCISPELLREVKQEMGDSRFVELLRGFSQSAAQMGGQDPEQAAVTALFEQGFPMLDMRKAATMPGLDPAMLRFLPEAQRAQIMQQMGGAGGESVSGTKVVKVEKDAVMPPLNLSGYKRQSFAEYMQQMMGNMNGMPRR
jgi:hypothetical protein